MKSPANNRHLRVLPCRGGHRQAGTVLVISLVILLILTILGLSAMRTSTLEQIMAGNIQESTRAFEAGESGLAKAFEDASSYSLSGGSVTATYPIASGAAGTAVVTTTFIQETPPKRGTGYGQSVSAAHYDQSSVATTTAGARTTVHQGVQKIVPKAN